MPLEIKRFGMHIHHDELGEYKTIADLDPFQPAIDIRTLKFRSAYDGELINNLVHHLNENFKLMRER